MGTVGSGAGGATRTLIVPASIRAGERRSVRSRVEAPAERSDGGAGRRRDSEEDDGEAEDDDVRAAHEPAPADDSPRPHRQAPASAARQS